MQPVPSLERRYLVDAAKFAVLQETMKTAWLKPDEIYGLLLSYKALGIRPLTETKLLPQCAWPPGPSIPTAPPLYACLV